MIFQIKNVSLSFLNTNCIKFIATKGVQSCISMEKVSIKPPPCFVQDAALVCLEAKVGFNVIWFIIFQCGKLFLRFGFYKNTWVGGDSFS